MDTEQELKRVADLYSAKGYDVKIRPKADELPPFAKDFHVEIAARRGSEGVLIAVKKTRDDIAADPDISRYAEITGAQPGWRFDFIVLEAEEPRLRDVRGAQEFSDEDINNALVEAEKMIKMGFVRPAIITAWSALEASMRLSLRASGERAGWGAAPRSMINELYSSGTLSSDEFAALERLFQLRNQIVHGFSSPTADAALVQFISTIAHRLLEEAQLAKEVV